MSLGAKAIRHTGDVPRDLGPRSLYSEITNSPAAVVDAHLEPGLVRSALLRATECLNSLQHPSGFWCGELEGDSILQSEYILLKFIIEQENDPRLPKIANYLRRQQRPSDGAWVQYPGGQPDLSATVKAYFALKLLGDSVDAPHMKKARDLVLKLGGAELCNTYSKFYLAALGQMHYDSIPVIPPELVLLPKWFYFHLDKVSAWSRTMIMPLAVISSYRPIRQLPAPKGIMELYSSHDYAHRPFIEFDKQLLSWKNLFLAIDRGLKLWERSRVKPLRRSALQKIEEWILKRADGQRSDGLGAIFPPMVQPMPSVRLASTRTRKPCARRFNGWRRKNAVISGIGRPTFSNRLSLPGGILNLITPITPTWTTLPWLPWRCSVRVAAKE
jgi:squalene-hopene/tetraprenyl-beta-curcumene cyclase